MPAPAKAPDAHVRAFYEHYVREHLTRRAFVPVHTFVGEDGRLYYRIPEE